MRKIFGVLVLVGVCVASTSQAASVSLRAGSNQSIALSDSAGRQVNVFVPTGGATHIDYSNGTGAVDVVPVDGIGSIVADLNTFFKAVVVGFDGAVVNEKMASIDGDPPARSNISVDANVGASSIDAATAKFTGFESTGGFSVSAPKFIASVSKGGLVTLKNLRFDLVNRQVVADVLSTPPIYDATKKAWVPGGVTTTTLNAVFWTFDAPVGPLGIPVSTLVTGTPAQIQSLGYELLPNGRGSYDYGARIKLPNLKITDVGMKIFANALGASPTVKSIMQHRNDYLDGWGSIVVSNRFSISASTCSP